MTRNNFELMTQLPDGNWMFTGFSSEFKDEVVRQKKQAEKQTGYKIRYKVVKSTK